MWISRERREGKTRITNTAVFCWLETQNVGFDYFLIAQPKSQWLLPLKLEAASAAAVSGDRL